MEWRAVVVVVVGGGCVVISWEEAGETLNIPLDSNQ